MKIALLAYSHVEHTCHLAKALSKKHDVLLIIPFKSIEHNKKLIDLFMGDSAQIFYFKTFSNYNIRNLSSSFSIRRKINDFSPDVICVQSYRHWFLPIMDVFLKFPTVLDLHDPIFHSGSGSTKYNKLNSLIKLIFIRLSDKIIVHGKKLINDFSIKYNYPKEDITVMLFGEYSISKIFDDTNLETKKNQILFFGRIHKYKGIDTLVKSEPLISSEIEDLEIVIAGDGPYKSYLNKIVNREKFTFLSKEIPINRLHKIFRTADIVVLPYLDATQSGVISLCLAYRKVMVLTDVGALAEMVNYGKSSVVVKPDSPKELSEGIVKVLKNTVYRSELERNMDTMIKNETNWLRSSESAEEAFIGAINKRRIYEKS